MISDCLVRFQGGDGQWLPGAFDHGPHVNTSRVHSVEHSMLQPRDPVTGEPTGNHEHRPLVIGKTLDRATPCLMRAMARRERLRVVVLEYFLPIDPMLLHPHVSVTLEGVTIVSHAHQSLSRFFVRNHRLNNVEMVGMAYEKIIWRDLINTVEAAVQGMMPPAMGGEG